MSAMVPRGWKQCPPEYLNTVLNSEPALFKNRFVIDNGSSEPSGKWEIVRFEVRSDIYVAKETSCAELLMQDVTEFARNEHGQAIARSLHTIRRWQAKPGYESKMFCHGCGKLLEDEQGRSIRNGFRCPYCGCM